MIIHRLPYSAVHTVAVVQVPYKRYVYKKPSLTTVDEFTNPALKDADLLEQVQRTLTKVMRGLEHICRGRLRELVVHIGECARETLLWPFNT